MRRLSAPVEQIDVDRLPANPPGGLDVRFRAMSLSR